MNSFLFFFQAEDGIRDVAVTGVQTCALPIYISRWWRVAGGLMMNLALGSLYAWSGFVAPLEKEFGWERADTSMVFTYARTGERRVGEEWRSRGSPDDLKKKTKQSKLRYRVVG